MKPLLALSTCWCSHRHHDGYAMLTEMAQLGFEHVELSHGIKITLVPGILRAVEAGVVRITSTHNFCPLPTGVMQAAPNLFEPSSPEPREIDAWLRHTRRTIEFAAQVKARVVVCHLGSVRFSWFNPGRKVRKYLESHPGAGRDPDNRAYAMRLEESTAKLRQKGLPFWNQVRASVQLVLENARQAGVKLGIENREKFEELPLDADLPAFMSEFPAGSPVGYWHDTGHAELKEAMGLLEHRAHLEGLSPHTMGFHLHDVNKEGFDHQPIGSGRIDFKMVSQFWRPEHLLTIELSPRVTREEVLASKERVMALIGG